MSKIVLKAENISKQYRLGQLGTGTLSHDLNRAWAKFRGKEDPYLRVGDMNDKLKVGGSDYVWSLKDINFAVKQGEVLGIIGKNGAGKSTLLKILSQVTIPTTGQVKVKGRIASLLEVGTGFHPDLSGRENIFLNGAILGMTKAEIKKKLDEIVDFSGVAKYLDTPVKRYSSGMTVRLGFAIAAHLEPEILIVDEVLAVGDAEFQEKCLGKMKDVSGHGRTVLFVSHNIQAIKTICNRGLLLQNGIVKCEGSIEQVISEYISIGKDYYDEEELDADLALINTGEGHIKKIRLRTGKNSGNEIYYEEPINIEIEFELYKEVNDFISDVRILSKEGIVVGYAMPKYDTSEVTNLRPGKYQQNVVMENNLQPDIYFLNIGIHYGKGLTIHYFEKVIQMRVLSIGASKRDYPVNWYEGNFRLSSKWNITS
jgi:lipopolysaccharide transport system ATP-binding protein